MTNVSEIVDEAVGRAPATYSANGGPPADGGSARTLAIVVVAAFLVGVAVARWLDWRTHAHPHD